MKLRTIRLSSLFPIDLETVRDSSLATARREMLAGRMRTAHIEVWPNRRRPVLSDGRHRVLIAMRLGVEGWPVIIRTYGPRGGVRRTEAAELILDALP